MEVASYGLAVSGRGSTKTCGIYTQIRSLLSNWT